MNSNSNMEMWFAAGTAAAVGSCAAVVPFSSERWRVWVFLALNVLLLAILYTSTSTETDTASLSSEEEALVEECKDQKKMKQEQSKDVVLENEDDNIGCESLKFSETMERAKVNEKVTTEEDGEDEARQDQVMSKEELNRKAEAFIAMFRQQLVLDAMNRSRVQLADKRRRSCS